jgi:sugar/nucleoside kinase (ribokinase family)
MIVVLGRPAAAAFPGTSDTDPDGVRPAGLAVEIARAAAAAGRKVELVGSIGDDAIGDVVVVGLDRAGVGHAALLRDPSAPTPRAGERASAAVRPPRLERADVELGLGYVVDYGVLVLAEPLPPEVEAAALDAAAFRNASVVAVVAPGGRVSGRLAGTATVLEAPRGASDAFAQAVGRFAAGLDAGAEPRDALTTAVRAAGWEASA